MIDQRQVEFRARQELQDEEFKKAVDAAKTKLRQPWWRYWFPWRIKISVRKVC